LFPKIRKPEVKEGGFDCWASSARIGVERVNSGFESLSMIS
jgi:hypothetical protein